MSSASWMTRCWLSPSYRRSFCVRHFYSGFRVDGTDPKMSLRIFKIFFDGGSYNHLLGIASSTLKPLYHLLASRPVDTTEPNPLQMHVACGWSRMKKSDLSGVELVTSDVARPSSAPLCARHLRALRRGHFRPPAGATACGV